MLRVNALEFRWFDPVPAFRANYREGSFDLFKIDFPFTRHGGSLSCCPRGANHNDYSMGSIRLVPLAPFASAPLSYSEAEAL